MMRQLMTDRSPVGALSALALVALLTLAGCGTMAPRYERPDSATPATWPATGPATGPTSSPTAAAGSHAQAANVSDIPWQDAFTNATVQRLIAIALDNNRDLRVSILNVEKARAQYQVNRAALFPTIDATADQSASRSTSTYGGTTQAMTSHQYSVGVGAASYELDLFGRVRSLRDQALQSYLGTEQARRAAQIALVAEVATAYLTWSSDTALYQLAQQTLAAQRSSFDITRKSFELGTASALDLKQAQTSVDSARVDVARYTAQIEQDRHALALLLGTTLPEDLAPMTDLTQGVIREVSAGVSSSVLLDRPDVREAEHTLQAANANIGAARAALFPRITLTASAGTASGDLSGLFKAGSGAWAFAPSVSLPLFDGGANRANLDAAKVSERIEVANYQKAIQTAFREVADALATHGTIDERLAAQQSLTDAYQAAYDLSLARYRKGVDSYLSVLVAQRSLYGAQQDLVTLRLTWQENLVTLYKVLGGGADA
ncbi:efflux transporter outer membrane subunit [Cupriavidus plantarum]|nr:Outer membrane protein OprM [Cupriavidus plantarum]SMR85132.1 outer membrane protein, multidrug efflux system [Cupriavidus plantarum]